MMAVLGAFLLALEMLQKGEHLHREAHPMTGVAYFPQIIPANTIVGRLGSNGPTEAVPLNILANTVSGLLNAAVRQTFDTGTADANPGSGKLRLNNANPALATAAYVSDLNADGASIEGWFQSFDDVGSSSRRGTWLIFDIANPGVNFRYYAVSGTVTDASPYQKITIAAIAGAGSFTANTQLGQTFVPAGATGTVASGADIDMLGFALLNAGRIDLGTGGQTDTSLTRHAAGVMAVEGVPLYATTPVNPQSSAYAIVLADANTTLLHPASDNNARTFTIPANASVAFPIGTIIGFVNKINVLSIAITSDTLTQTGSGLTGTRTLAANGVAFAEKITATEWIITGSGLS